MQDNEKFLKHIGDNYADVQLKLKMLCGRNKQRYDEDAFHEAIIRCHTAITKKGKLNDSTPYGIESYLIKSYFNYIKEEARSCKVSKRDSNITSDNIDQVYENWYNANKQTSRIKLVNDLYIDYATLYVMHKVELNFDNEHFYLFRLKTLCEMTYKQLCEKTGIQGCRQKVIDVKNWVKENISKDEINEAFHLKYGELL